MADQFEGVASSLVSPAAGAFSIVPSDIGELAQPPRALYVGAGGSLVVEMMWGGIVTFGNLPSGSLLPIRVRRVLAASTAGSLVGLY